MHGIDCSELRHVNWYSGTVEIGKLVHWYIGHWHSGHWTTEIKNKLSRDKVYSAQKREASKALFSHCCAAEHCSVRQHWSNPLQCILLRMQCVVVGCGLWYNYSSTLGGMFA